ncbi:MAG: hypothetical protein J3K34DRAFT_188165 [Monoraphidium minutum]|nr:MAG: hypothetical protein J3K34DRAFT_188165 [Monoraphidium minutum]
MAPQMGNQAHLRSLITDGIKDFERTYGALPPPSARTHGAANSQESQVLVESLRALQATKAFPTFAAGPALRATAAAPRADGGAAKGQPWLMPWQTGDRAAGAAMARAIGSKRTPLGAFANFDLPKAPN